MANEVCVNKVRSRLRRITEPEELLGALYSPKKSVREMLRPPFAIATRHMGPYIYMWPTRHLQKAVPAYNDNQRDLISKYEVELRQRG